MPKMEAALAEAHSITAESQRNGNGKRPVAQTHTCALCLFRALLLQMAGGCWLLPRIRPLFLTALPLGQRPCAADGEPLLRAMIERGEFRALTPGERLALDARAEAASDAHTASTKAKAAKAKADKADKANKRKRTKARAGREWGGRGAGGGRPRRRRRRADQARARRRRTGGQACARAGTASRGVAQRLAAHLSALSARRHGGQPAVCVRAVSAGVSRRVHRAQCARRGGRVPRAARAGGAARRRAAAGH